MPKFSSLKDLNKFVEKNIEIVANQLGEIVEKELIFWLKETVYKDSPFEYHRTFELLNSITIGDLKKDKNKISCSVYFDSSKINQTLATNSWNHHMSVFGYKEDKKYNEPINEMIPYYLNYGTDSPIYSHDEHLFLEKTIESLNDGKLRKKMIEYLSEKGIVVR